MIDLSAYRTLFADRELRRIMLGSVLPRLPIGMNALGLTLLVQAATGSFAQAGWVSGAYMAALALQAPVVGRFIDQRGPRGVMLPLAAGHTLALLVGVGPHALHKGAAAIELIALGARQQSARG